MCRDVYSSWPFVRGLFLFCIILPCFIGNARGITPHCRKFIMTFKHLQKLSNFIKSDIRDLNVDGLAAVQMGYGHLKHITKAQVVSLCGGTLGDRIFQQLTRTRRVAALIIRKKLRSLSRGYEQSLLPLLGHLGESEKITWRWLVYHATNHDTAHAPRGDDEYNEKEGDVCFRQLMKTKTHAGCVVDDNCRKMFLGNYDSTGYYRTHELLYISVYRKANCHKNVNAVMNSSDLDNRNNQLCNGVFKEVQKNIRGTFQHFYSKDEVIEQIVVCASVGYLDFIRFDWMKIIWTWQRRIGCYGRQHHNYSPGRRRLLVDRVMKDGCSSHETGLAYALYSVYLRSWADVQTSSRP